MSNWERHVAVMLSATGNALGKKFAKLMWCNPRQPRFASVFCASVKDPGALVVVKKGEKSAGLPVHCSAMCVRFEWHLSAFMAECC